MRLADCRTVGWRTGPEDHFFVTLDWQHFVVLAVDQSLVELAGEYADAFGLRAYDAVQLASATRRDSPYETIIEWQKGKP